MQEEDSEDESMAAGLKIWSQMHAISHEYWKEVTLPCCFRIRPTSQVSASSFLTAVSKNKLKLRVLFPP